MFDFLKKLLASNPTEHWVDAGVTPTVDVARCELLGNKATAPLDQFSRLGPAGAEINKHGNGWLKYAAKGLHIEFESRQLTCVQVFLDRFSGRLFAAGRPLALRLGASETDVIALLGEPASRDDDEEEAILRYEFGEVVAEFELPRATGLSVINTFYDGELKPDGPA